MKSTILFKNLWLLLVLLSPFGLSAQLSGIHSVPGTFTSLAAVINSLNAGGTSGPTTINIAAGYTETAVYGGYQLNANSFPITFRKSGVGTNPLLIAYLGGVGTPTDGTVQDGVWRFVGCDNLVIDAIDILDPNTNVTAMMEYGYGFFKANSFNGCQNNIVRNCNITLNNLNQISDPFNKEFGGSKGIYLSCATTTFYTQSANISNFAGTNSNNKFYSNYIQNCHIGISIPGYNSQGYLPACDQKNDVGGLLAATGNTIVNFGGGSISNYCAGIVASYQYSLNASFNVIQNNNGSGLNPGGEVYGIGAFYYSAADASINNNTITLNVPLSTNTVFAFPQVYGIRCSATTTIASITPTANISINNNYFPGFNFVSGVNPQGISSLIYHSINPAITSISNNLMFNVNVVNSQFEAIHCAVASTCNINTNTISNVTSSLTSSIGQAAIRCDAISGYVTQNLISNINLTNANAGGFVGIQSFSNIKFASVSSNTISNVNAMSSTGVQISNSVNQSTFNVVNNSVFGFSAPSTSTVNCSAHGIWVSTSGVSSTGSITANSIYSLSNLCATTPANTSSRIWGIYQSNVSSIVSRNKIYSLYHNVQYAEIRGIFSSVSTGNYATSQISNNLITDFECAGGNNFISAIFNDRYYSTIAFNSIYLAGTSTGSACISEGIRLNGSTTTGSGLSQVVNNIIVNNTPSFGGGLARGIFATSINYYDSQSNRNIIYSGLPASDRLIATVGANNYSLITSFKAAVFPREIQTFTENPVFTTTVSSLPNVLSLNPTVTTLAESGAVPISGILTDFAGTIRNTLTPDIGAWEDNLSGFDRVPPLVNSSGFTNLPCNNFTNRIFTISITEANGVAMGSLSPRIYYRVNSGSYTSSQGVLTAGTASNGVWTFTMNYFGSLGNTISYYVVAQDLSSFNNFLVHPFGGGIFNSVNSVNTHPTQVGSYILQTYPTINVNSGYLCLGKTFTMTPSGASTYTFSSGSATVNPTVNTSYTITGTSSSGCIATVAAVSNVTVQAYPTITVSSGAVCIGQTSFNINPVGASTYTYYGGGPLVSPLIPTSYLVVGATEGGCRSTNTAIAVVQVNALPQVDFTGMKDFICVGESVTLSAAGAQNYTFIPGGVGTSVVVTPSVNTNYTVVGADINGCKATAYYTQIVVLCESVTEKGYDEGALKLFPNPCKDAVFIRLENEGLVHVTNSLGQIVYGTKVSSGTNKINVENLCNGIYFLSFNTSNGTKSLKFIKE